MVLAQEHNILHFQGSWTELQPVESIGSGLFWACFALCCSVLVSGLLLNTKVRFAVKYEMKDFK